ncbi:putative 5' nucleotidase family protein [Monocercomonoides exilis]|uniref:putative 5' nucleotidase family protein n=1 Tax=Monocercomonoides exilis TaxID=2049356 RepID=UPI00355A51D4|nr:putative 5' nucleotidase family protein [Monocercomonoides exilis]|eukprot:MONOS_10659.1-p1 / transcript=MONOS_10659.1 / gene=MONOS_10659 / organism=Monocercomonoides_exilis_PA203 / gene_product=5' nucleotidase family protein / transcript_product=5' nucleotidase family protein / location=Mono_scaffold00493:521-2929(-) / protein_length=554 / sequence_SO=supercontig / SO=protein_coding / is_pseudo=false
MITIILFCFEALFAVQSNANINVTIIHTTDIHGWINSHVHDSRYDAGVWDLYNFVDYYKRTAGPNDLVLLLDTGDLTQGTGLSDATPIQGQFIFDVMKLLPFDGLAIGNHELGNEDCINNIADNFAPFWNGRYLGWNVEHTNPNKKLTGDYFTIKLPNNQGNILVMGFLYNMHGAASNVKITPINQLLTENRFRKAFSEPNVKMIINLCHIATNASEIKQLHNFISQHKPDTPQLYLTGHSHLIRTKDLDTLSTLDAATTSSHAFAMESGAFARQLGFIRFTLSPNGIQMNEEDGHMSNAVFIGENGIEMLDGGDLSSVSSDSLSSSLLSKLSFQHYFVNYNHKTMLSWTKTNDSTFNTPAGNSIHRMVSRKYYDLNLGRVIGYSKYHYYKNQRVEEGQHSLSRLVLDEMLPAWRWNINNAFFIVGTSSLRADIYEGTVVVDDVYAVDPFNNMMFAINNVSGEHINQLKKMRFDGRTFFDKYAASSTLIDPNGRYTIISSEYDAKNLLSALNTFAPGSYAMRSTSFSLRPIIHQFILKNWNNNSFSSFSELAEE